MGINKNFVVKNGFEVSNDLIVADSNTRSVGIGSTTPKYTLDVSGGIGVTDIYVSGLSTFFGDVEIKKLNNEVLLKTRFANGYIGIGTGNALYPLDIRSSFGIGQTSIYIGGSTYILGNANFGNSVNIGNELTVSGSVTANQFFGDGSGLVNVGIGLGTELSINTTGIITATAFFGDGSGLIGVGVGEDTSINTTGIITATAFFGDGSGLTGAGSSAVVDNDTDEDYYLTYTDTTSGIVTESRISTTKLKFNPSSSQVSIGQTPIILNGNNKTITGVSSLTSTFANISNIKSVDINTTNLLVNNELEVIGINTQTQVPHTVTIKGPFSEETENYEFILPSKLGQTGQVLTVVDDGTLEFRTPGVYENRIFVSSINGNDSNDGKSAPVKTIKKAAQLASFESPNPVAIVVEAGEYLEDNPIILYEDVALIGDNLRNTIIRPLNANKDLFRVRNGCYLSNFAMKDYVDQSDEPQHTFNWAIAFDDPLDTSTSRTGYKTETSKPTITRSPYIQNCSILSFLGANGVLVDGSKVSTPNLAPIVEESENPVVGDQPEHGKSIVANAFTMVSFGGIGWRVINDGYSQVVSCFQIFCKYGSLAQSGGYLSITNSATNFGLYALKSSGYNANCYDFDKGLVAATGIIEGKQSLKIIGLGRVEQDLYVLRFINKQSNIDQTGLFKPLTISREVDISVGVNTTTDIIEISNHGFVNEDRVLYLSNESANPQSVIGGLIGNNEYYVEYISDNQFKLYEDESLTKVVDLTSFTVGINTFQKGNVEFFNQETVRTHNTYQILSLGSTSETLTFVPGRSISQLTPIGTAFGYVYDYDDQQNNVIVSVEEVEGERNNFVISGLEATQFFIQDHSNTPISIAVTATSNTNQYFTSEIKVNSTDDQSIIANIGNLPEDYILQFHRPSIVNSSAHTWEFSGAGTDYNALPQNGGKGDPTTEQVISLGGRVYASGTNELGDFKIGTQITAFNRTGNITFNNKVSIAEIDSINLSLSGGVTISEFSTDVGLGDNEIGGPKNNRVSTQLAVRSFLNNRLGNFIDKVVSTSPIPNSVLQLNAFGQINPDLVPPKVVNFYTTNVGGGRTTLVDNIPSVNIKQGDTVVEPDGGFVLVSDLISEYLILDSNTRNYNFNNGNEVVSALSNGSAIGIVTAPTTVGYGTTGLVKGVLLSVNNLNGGSGYSTPGTYNSIPLVSVTGAGTSALASIIINESGVVSSVSVTYGGKGYQNGDVLSASSSSIGGIGVGGNAFQVTVNNIETRLYLKLTNNTRFPGTVSLPDYIKDNDSVGVSTTLDLNYALNFNPTDSTISGDIDFSNDRIIVGPNLYSDGDPVIYSSGGSPNVDNLVSGSTYYVKRVGISSIELYTTYALSNKISLVSSSTGTHTLTRVGVNTSTEQIILTNHGFTQGDSVRITGNTPSGITTNSFYFVGAITQNSFSLHQAQFSAFASANGLIIDPINLTSTGSGQITFTKQNVSYSKTVNTSSSLLDNWSSLSGSVIDAQNIVSGIISPARLGTGSATEDTFLSGDSSYQKVIKSVSVASTEPINVVASSSSSSSGITTYFGDINLSLNRVQSTEGEFSTLGIGKFKTSNFLIGSDGSISIKSSTNGGDIDATTFGGQNPAFYLDINNITGSLPIARGGTGLSALPSNGHLLVGNGSAYNLTGSPTISGTLTGSISIPANGDIVLNSGTWSGEKASKIQTFNDDLYLQYTNNLVARNSLGTNRMTLTSGGDATFSGTVTANSDEKLKENIKTIDNALDKVKELRGVEFDRKESGEHQIGVIAQEVEKIIPEVVYENDGIKSVAYGNLVGLLIEAIKEQQLRIEELEKKVDG